MATDPRQNPGFRQYDPGIFTDDEAFAKGMGYDPTGKSINLAAQDIGGFQRTAPTTGIGNPDKNTNQIAGPAPAPAPAPGPLPPSAGPNPAAAPAAAAPAAAGPVPSYADTSGTARQILTDQMKGLSGETTAASPEIAPAIAAYNTQSQRDQQMERDQLAEREYATNEGTGLKSGGFNTNVQAGAERAALGRANFTGSAIMQVAQQKRAQLTDMLKTAVSSGLTDKAQQIQAMIAQIDAHLRQQGITNQLAEYGTGAGQEQQRITNQNTQANNVLGFSYADLQARMNRDALLAGLSG